MKRGSCKFGGSKTGAVLSPKKGAVVSQLIPKLKKSKESKVKRVPTPHMYSHAPATFPPLPAVWGSAIGPCRITFDKAHEYISNARDLFHKVHLRTIYVFSYYHYNARFRA